MQQQTSPFLGFGAGLRAPHQQHILENLGSLKVDWFEIISENHMNLGGWPLELLDRVGAVYPIIPHGVSLSIGTTDPLNQDYLRDLKTLCDELNPPWVSDHLCWTGVGGHNSHDLLPLPYTEESLAHVSDRVKEVQDTLGRRLILENPSSYLSFAESTLTEWDFLARLVESSDCGLLLDVNNVYVCQRNHGWDAQTYINTLPSERILQIHIAGHSDYQSHCIDTHIGPICQAVWDIYLQAINHCGPVSTLLEWDQDIPEFSVLEAELDIARHITETRNLPSDLPADNRASALNGDSVSNPVDHLLRRANP